MNESTKAVFLSYASHDAEAAKRICEALRAAGVEVWFDQSELVGGDQWDQKIRGQIASCALFVPVISANTEARLEGYFRLEWKLAAQRTHTMADEKTFLVPVVIDDTKDAVAKVPAEFKAVQWTRLRRDQTPAGFAARIKALLDHAGQPSPAVPVEHAPAGPFKKTPLRSRWAWGIPLLIAAGFGVWALQHSGRNPEPRSERRAPEGPALTGRVRELLRKPGLVRADLDAAELLAKRATELDPSDGEAWAALSRVNTMIVNLGMERTAARRAMARDLAGRAMGLAPHSFHVRFTQADYWLRGEVAGTDRRPNAAAAQALLEELARERPADPEVQITLAVLKPFEEKREILERVAADPEMGWRALTDLGWAHYFIDEYAEADKVADRAIALYPHWGSLALKIYLALYWRGDLDLAQATLARMPPAARQEDWPVMIAYTVADIRSDPAAMLAAVQDNPQEWLSSLQGEAPRAFFLAEARRRMGQLDAAQRDYRRVLVQLEPRLAATPNDENLLALKAEALWWCGEQAEARRVYQLADALGRGLSWRTRALFDDKEVLFSRLSRSISEGVIWTAASLRLNPAFQRLRGDERFEALVSRAEADPKRSPQASRSPSMPASSPTAADKSVAVLAFANLSDDKANEYFSDGVSEELMTVLQKIPGLHVAARSSAFSFKGTKATAQEIGAKLGVAHLVEGSVQKSAGRVKITARLSRVANGEELWSKSFPAQELKDVFVAQEEIARAIVGELRERLTGTLDEKARGEIAAQVRAAERGGTQDPEAQELFLQGRFAERQISVEGSARAENFYRRATERDPRFARAWAGLGGTIFWQAGNLVGTRTLDRAAEEARRAIQHALALEPELDEGLLALASIQFLYDLDAQAARATVHRALAVAPTAPVLAAAASLESAQGHHEPALALARRAVALDPLDESARASLRAVLFNLGRFDELQAEWRRALAASPDMAFLHGELAGWAILEGRWDEAERAVALEKLEYARDYLRILLLGRQGRKAESEAQLRNFEQNNASGAAFQIAMVYADRGDREQAFAWLERAYRQHDGGIMGLRVNPYFRPLHGDPRWQPLLRKLGLADEQVK